MAEVAAGHRISPRALGALGVSFATVSWGLVPLVLKQTEMPTLAFASYRLWFGVAVYGVAMAATGRRLRWSTLRACALGGLFFGADVAFIFNAFKLTSVANATIIGALAPVFIALGAARWFGERIDRRSLAVILVAFAGVAVVAVGSSGSASWSPLGDMFAALSTVSWTTYWLFSKRARRTVPTLEYMTSVMLVAAVIVTATTAVSGVSLAPPRGTDWAWIWAITLIPGATGHLLVAWSHRHLEAWVASLITQSQPIVASIAAWAIIGEVLTPLTAAGGLVVIGATVVILVRERWRAPGEIEPQTPATAG